MSLKIDSLVLGTAQFGLDYGVANKAGKPSKQEVFKILSSAWESGIRKYDTAPDYGPSEELLGEFIRAHGVQDSIEVLTKIPKLSYQIPHREFIEESLARSIERLGCSIKVLFFHDPSDSLCLLYESRQFEEFQSNRLYPSLGVSVYECSEVVRLANWKTQLAFQYPYNVVDRRFENIEVPASKTYVRSVFLQGVLSSQAGLRSKAPASLVKFQEKYQSTLKRYDYTPLNFALDFVLVRKNTCNLVIGVDSASQLLEITGAEVGARDDFIIDEIIEDIKINPTIGDPRQWDCLEPNE